MPNPVSIIRWRDAMKDPPTGDMNRRIQAVHRDGAIEECDAYFLAEEDYVWWAELPVLSELTDEDVAHAADALIYCHNDGMRRGVFLTTRMPGIAARLRAALGKKEET